MKNNASLFLFFILSTCSHSIFRLIGILRLFGKPLLPIQLQDSAFAITSKCYQFLLSSSWNIYHPFHILSSLHMFSFNDSFFLPSLQNILWPIFSKFQNTVIDKIFQEFRRTSSLFTKLLQFVVVVPPIASYKPNFGCFPCTRQFSSKMSFLSLLSQNNGPFLN